MTSAIEVLGIEHIDLTVSDVQRSLLFYEKVMPALGFRKLGADEGHRWANAHLSIEIRPATGAKDARHDRYSPGLHHLAFRARTRGDVDWFHQFLVKNKLEVLDSPADYPQYGEGYFAVFFADPDGLKLELAYFPWGYWKRAQIDGADSRPRYPLSNLNR